MSVCLLVSLLAAWVAQFPLRKRRRRVRWLAAAAGFALAMAVQVALQVWIGDEPTEGAVPVDSPCGETAGGGVSAP